MDFFKEQEVARRNARLLTALFICAVVILILLTNALVAGVLFVGEMQNAGADLGDANSWFTHFNSQTFLAIGAGVSAVIGCVVLVNWLRFSQGGDKVAEALGGRPALPNSGDPLERRAQNIVQEIALAANMPVPPLYILDDERGINAFAAGVRPNDAVVAITRGAMVHLNRSELQGVIGHEFSHILNGDMRLSVRLAAMLRGITFIGDIGHVMMRSGAYSRRSRSDKNDNRAALIVVGLALYLIGLLGGLMAGLIKSAISKQKEYLADASAVQFTRDPDSIGNALKVIGGYTPGTLVHSARAEELSHLFFGQVKHRLWSWFATHPPLEDRIRKLDPSWDGKYITRPPDHSALEQIRLDESGEIQATRAMTAAGIVIGASVAARDAAPEEGPADHENTGPKLGGKILEASQDPLGAMALILALLWHDNEFSEAQAQQVREAGIKGLEPLVEKFGHELSSLAEELKLPLIEITLPTLKLMSVKQYQTFTALLLKFIRADQRIDLFEWCLYQLVRHYLDPNFSVTTPSKPKHNKLEPLQDPISVVLGTLATVSSDDTAAAFGRGTEELNMTLQLPPSDQLGVAAFSKAVRQLADAYPLLKVRILKAMASTAAYDGTVCSRELTLIKAIAAVIDCPVPEHMLPTKSR